MRLAIIGGRLQGVEAAYLAAEAGFESTVVDQDEKAPAAELCSRFVCGNVLNGNLLRDICGKVDMVLPAVENQEILNALEAVCLGIGVPLVYDPKAYAISASKQISDRLFHRLKIPAPLPWPNCDFPVVCKPSSESGSKGVRVLDSHQEAQAYIGETGADSLVIQEYLEGPSYSIEVVGNGREFATLQTTELFMDDFYDCKRVLAPAGLSTEMDSAFREIALKIASELKIHGIFDVESIYCNGEFKILEIDARLPSQTPTAVLHSSGINMMELLWKSARGDSMGDISIDEKQACLYEHILVDSGRVSVCGEHIMGQNGILHYRKGFWGADIALTSYTPGATRWVATLIYIGASRKKLLARHEDTIAELGQALL